MKLRRENIRISLQGKSKEELTAIYNLLISLEQTMYSSLERDLINLRDWECYEFYSGKWCLSNNVSKTKVTLQQLKEILQPKDLTLEQQLNKAEAEVKRLREAIEASKIKEGDWCTFWNHDKSKSIIAKFQGSKFACITSGDYFLNCEKITDSVLLEILNKMS